MRVERGSRVCEELVEGRAMRAKGKRPAMNVLADPLEKVRWAVADPNVCSISISAPHILFSSEYKYW